MRHLWVGVGVIAVSACAAHAPLYGPIKPTARLVAPVTAYVDNKWPLGIVLYGDFPPGELGVEVSVGHRAYHMMPVHLTAMDIAVARAKTVSMTFTDNFYWQMKRLIEGSEDPYGFGRNLSSMPGADCSVTGECVWDEFVDVDVRVCELHWSTSLGYTLGRTYATAHRRVKLMCVNCIADEDNEV